MSRFFSDGLICEEAKLINHKFRWNVEWWLLAEEYYFNCGDENFDEELEYIKLTADLEFDYNSHRRM